jgi:uncharacterized protein YbcC (UPF0753/DUF2309 family)
MSATTVRHANAAPPIQSAGVEPASALHAAVMEACARIAPAWPLDRMIAVNPFWGFISESMATTAERVAALNGAHMLMPNEWYRERWRAGAFSEHDAIRAMGEDEWSRIVAGGGIESLFLRSASTPRLVLMTDVMDGARDASRAMTWNDFTVDHISRSCAAHFDQGQSVWRPDGDDGLFFSWRSAASRDHSPALAMGHRGFRSAVATLPHRAWPVIAEALAELRVAECDWAMYCSALLMSVNGWASACAYYRWNAALESRTDDAIVELLAIRLSWEVILLRGATPAVAAAWAVAKDAWRGGETKTYPRRAEWCLQRAMEFAYQLPLARQLSNTKTQRASVLHGTPQSQIAFCIDVRSEPYRRALEGVAPDVHTLGFAGFFGAPIAYRSASGVERPQLPGLLPARLVVEDFGDQSARAKALGHLDDRWLRATTTLKTYALTGFPFIEMTGMLTVPKLLRSAFGNSGTVHDVARGGADGPLQEQLKPRIIGDPFDDVARTALAANLLRGMSLTRDFAPLLVLVGHTSHSCNNPQSASLGCGACGGQSGEVNARVMAALLNEPQVRRGLLACGIDLPSTTHVTAGVHDTTTDEVTLYDGDSVPPSHVARWRELKDQLQRAGDEARRRRAPSLRMAASTSERLRDAFRKRAGDWSEVRPEWGLARNAAFIVAPRSRTSGIDLDGRAFLHEYRPELDVDHTVLEAIMTAPMLVTHWINMQYYASTVDNLKYGSGDKTLHNVVGASLGVLEGASGDLRTGLALQSLHDGDRWYHEPLRLSVFIEATADAIDDVIRKHTVVRHLVEGEWLYLFRIDSASGIVSMRSLTGWQSVDDSTLPSSTDYSRTPQPPATAHDAAVAVRRR